MGILDCEQEQLDIEVKQILQSILALKNPREYKGKKIKDLENSYPWGEMTLANYLQDICHALDVDELHISEFSSGISFKSDDSTSEKL